MSYTPRVWGRVVGYDCKSAGLGLFAWHWNSSAAPYELLDLGLMTSLSPSFLPLHTLSTGFGLQEVLP